MAKWKSGGSNRTDNRPAFPGTCVLIHKSFCAPFQWYNVVSLGPCACFSNLQTLITNPAISSIPRSSQYDRVPLTDQQSLQPTVFGTVQLLITGLLQPHDKDAIPSVDLGQTKFQFVVTSSQCSTRANAQVASSTRPSR